MIKSFGVYAGWLEPEELIGTCSVENARGREVISFSYSENWLLEHAGFFLDPNIYPMTGRQYPPEGLSCFGFLSDLAPDRWGRTLMNKKEGIEARKDKRPRRKLMESDYILGVHDEGRLGGIRLKDESGKYLSEDRFLAAPPLERLRDLEEASLMLESDKTDEERWLNALLLPGSSLGGARPKSNVVDELGDMWIAKFPSRNDQVDVGAWEMVAHNLALRCGIQVPEARIMRFSEAGSTFLVKRFDRCAGKRIHFSSAMTMTGMEDMEPAGYLDLVGIIEQISYIPEKDLHELWNRMIFNICISNTDDHLRNHGFLLMDKGWSLSPAYDINPNIEKEEMSLFISETCRKDVGEALEIADFFRLTSKEALENVERIQKIIRCSWETEAGRIRIPSGEREIMKNAFLFE